MHAQGYRQHAQLSISQEARPVASWRGPPNPWPRRATNWLPGSA